MNDCKASRIIFLTVMFASSVSLLGSTNTQAELPPPNIVWIMSEDNSVHYLDHFFPGGAPTPAITKLAQEGITFRRCFSNAPVCSVARTTLITGCYAPRFATQYHRRHLVVTLPDNIELFPAYLRQAGYYTTNNSKEDYNTTGSNVAWNESAKTASWKNRPIENTPFFHVQTFTTSHESSLHFSATDFENNLAELDPSPAPHAYLPDTPLVRYTHATYLNRIQQIDQKVAEIVTELQQDGQWDNTIVFYFGDHGGVLPRSKGYVYDTGLHVPLVIRIPQAYRQLWDLQAASKDDRIVQFVDFAPTVLSLANIQQPRHFDGHPFLGNLIADPSNFTAALGYADRFDEKYDLVRSIHKGEFHYIRCYQPFYTDGLHNEYRYKMLAYEQWRNMFRNGELKTTQAAFFQRRPMEMLFRPTDDPFEVNNLAAEEQYAEVLEELRDELTARLKALPDLSFLGESNCFPIAAEDPVAFSGEQKEQIGRLIDIANTCIAYSADDQELLTASLDSPQPLERFWALTSLASRSCCDQSDLTTIRDTLSADVQRLLSDPDIMVRARAAEALYVISNKSPLAAFKSCLQASRSELETLWLLNCVANWKEQSVPAETESLNLPVKHHNPEIERRIRHLSPNLSP